MNDKSYNSLLFYNVVSDLPVSATKSSFSLISFKGDIIIYLGILIHDAILSSSLSLTTVPFMRICLNIAGSDLAL